MPAFIDLSGRTFGRLTVLSRALDRVRTSGKTRAMWLCRCECGRERIIQGAILRSGASRSCGCFSNELRSKALAVHGMGEDNRYGIWRAMKERCRNPEVMHYRYYGGRGIQVCQRWDESFMAFAADMGRRPSGSHSIHRINNDGDYEPGNCRWATRTEQMRMTRRNRRIRYDGITLCLAEWAASIGISHSGLSHRLDHLRWNLARALTTPPRARTTRGSKS